MDVLVGQAGTSAIRQRLFAEGQNLCAPGLLRLETLDVLRRLSRAGQISETAAHLALVNFVRMPIHFYSEDALVRRIWNLRGHITAYDAAFVALAESLNAPLLTRDQKLAGATGTKATIEFVPLALTA